MPTRWIGKPPLKYSFSVMGSPETGKRMAMALKMKLEAKMPRVKMKKAEYGVILPASGAAFSKFMSIVLATKP